MFLKMVLNNVDIFVCSSLYFDSTPRILNFLSKTFEQKANKRGVAIVKSSNNTYKKTYRHKIIYINLFLKNWNYIQYKMS